MLAGVRMIDKSRNDQGSFRLEIWTKFSSKETDIGQNMIKYLREKFVDVIKGEDTDTELSFGKGDTDPIVFKQHKMTHDDKPSARPQKQQ